MANRTNNQKGTVSIHETAVILFVAAVMLAIFLKIIFF
jgi:hypothetical protein